MNAFEMPNLRFSLPAVAAVVRRRFISVDSDGNAIQATDATVIVGASMNAVVTDAGVTAAQQIVEIADGLVIVEAGGAVTAGAKVASDADGKAVAVVAQTIIAGTAITGATAEGQFITVKL